MRKSGSLPAMVKDLMHALRDLIDRAAFAAEGRGRTCLLRGTRVRYFPRSLRPAVKELAEAAERSEAAELRAVLLAEVLPAFVAA